MPARPVSGNKNLLVSLSSASKMPLPMIVKSLHKLNDNSAAIPNSQITVLAAMVLGNYVIKDMGGNIADAYCTALYAARSGN